MKHKTLIIWVQMKLVWSLCTHIHVCVCKCEREGGKNGNIFVISLLCHKDSIADGSESWGLAPLHTKHTRAQTKQLHLNHTEEALLFQAIQALIIF